MATITGLLVDNANSLMETKTNVNLQGQPFSTFKYKSETLDMEVQAVEVYSQDITGNTTMIWGSETYGIWGQYYWGTDYTNSTTTLSRVIPPSRLFKERFLTEYFIDSTSSTASVGSGQVYFTATSEILVSKTIYYDLTSIASATISITSTSGSNFTAYLSNDNQATWEEFTLGSEQSFVSSAGQMVSYKLKPTSPNQYLTYVQVQVNPQNV